MSETGSCSPKQGPTVWVSHCASPMTQHHPTYTMSSPLETGKELRGGALECVVKFTDCCWLMFSVQILSLTRAHFFLHQVWDAGLWCHPRGYIEELLIGPLFPQFLPNRGCAVCPSLATIRPGRLSTFLYWFLLLASSGQHSTGMNWTDCADSARNCWDQTEFISQTPM